MAFISFSETMLLLYLSYKVSYWWPTTANRKLFVMSGAMMSTCVNIPALHTLPTLHLGCPDESVSCCSLTCVIFMIYFCNLKSGGLNYMMANVYINLLAMNLPRSCLVPVRALVNHLATTVFSCCQTGLRQSSIVFKPCSLAGCLVH